MRRLWKSTAGLSANWRVTISLSFAIIIWFVLRSRMQLGTHMIATWDAYAISALTMAWIGMLNTSHQEIRQKVKRQDVAGPLITVFVILASSAALLAVIFLLRHDKNSSGSHLALHVALTLLAVLSSWTLVHTVFGLHYAHTYYGDSDNPKEPAGGLDFPGEKKPGYLDFAYFSFVIGMTFQVSDVQVTAGAMRKLVLLHGILSFAFNTLILALAVSTVTSLV